MIELLNHWADAWAGYAVMAVIQNTLFLGLILLALSFLKSYPAKWRYRLTLAAALKLWVPLFFTLPQSAPQMIPMGLPAATLPASTPIKTVAQSAAPQLSVQALFMGLWALGVLLMLAIPLAKTLGLWMKLRHAEPMGPVSPNSHIQLMRSEHVPVPMTLGLFPRRIYVPRQWPQWSESCRQMALAHELAHIHRADGFFQVLQFLATAFYFFHPLAWLLSRQMNELREMACDDAALAPQKGTQTQSECTSITYSRALVEIAENMQQIDLGCVSASALIKRRNELFNRIQYQMEDSMKKIPKVLQVTIIVSVLLLTLGLSWATQSPHASGATTPQAMETSTTSSTDTLSILSGRVVNSKEGEKIVAGATVQVEGSGQKVTTDSQGRFSVKKLPAGGYSLRVSKPGFETIVYKNIELEEESKHVFTLRLKPGDNSNTAPQVIDKKRPVLSGLVLNGKTKNAFAGASVTLNETGETYRCGESGFFHFQNLQPGTYSLTVSHPGFETVVLKSLHISTDAMPNPRITLNPGDDAVQTEEEFNKEKTSVFYAFDQAPVPVGGWTALKDNLVYPEAEKKAKISGPVMVYAQINEKGKVVDCRILQSPSEALSQSAIAAIKATPWKPALLKDKPVMVWVAVPVVFNLSKDE